MTTKAMPLLLNSAGKHLELRNSAEGVVTPSTQLKSGEDARAAAKRALEEFFGFSAPEDAIREGFQARVGNEVVAVFPVDANKMEMGLLRPAEEVATWAWRDVPDCMGDVVALGFPRNVERRNSARENGLVNVFSTPASASDFAPPAAPAHATGPEASAQYEMLQHAVAAKAASLKDAPAHQRAARAEELAQATEDLRLLAADMGIEQPGRLNAADAAKGPLTARALIRQNDGSIIAARQKDGRSLLPGGHIENGETPEGAVARELQEELGLDIKEAMTGESYDFHGEDGSSHRVFVVDGSKLDLSKLTPGDDVEDAEFVNSPFTDSHGAVHPQEGRENGGRFERPCPDCGGGAYIEDAAGNDVKCPKCKGTGVESVSQMKNDAGGDVAEIERHVEGIKHEVGEIEKQNAGGKKDSKPADGKCELCGRRAPKLEYREGWGGQDNKGWVCADGKGCDSKENAATRENSVQKYVFKDAEGEDVTIEANSEVSAWNKLADQMSTPVGDMKRMGVKLMSIRQNADERENSYGNFSIEADLRDGVSVDECARRLHERYPDIDMARAKKMVEQIKREGAAARVDWTKNSAGKENGDERENAWTPEFLKRNPDYKSKIEPKLARKWDSASAEQRAAWLKQTGSHQDDAELSFAELTSGSHGSSQAEVMMELMARLCGERINAAAAEKVPGNNLEAGAHNHQYPDRLNGAFPALLCDGNETIATQETTDGWRCEHCGDVIAGPPKPETVIDQP